MNKDEAWDMIDSSLDHCYSEKDVLEIKAALAQLEEQQSCDKQEPLGFVVMERQPLTDFEIVEALMPVNVFGDGYYLRIARAIEAAHGIGDKT